MRRVGRELRRAAPKAPDLSGTTTSASRRRSTASTARSASSCPSGGCRPRSCASSAASPASTATRRAAPHPPAERAAPLDPERPRRALLAEPLNEELTPTRRSSTAGCRRARARSSADWPRSTQRVAPRDRRLPRRARPPNGHGEDFRLHFAGLLVELRPAADRRHRDRGRAQEGRRRVHRGDGHPHRRAPRRPSRKLGDVVLKKVPHWDLNETLLKIFSVYEHHHDEGETFREFAARTAPEWWTQRARRR